MSECSSEKCMQDFRISLEWADDQQPTPKRKRKLRVGQSYRMCDGLQVRMHKDVHTVTMVTTILQPLRVKGTASTVSFRRALYLRHPVLSLGNQAHTRATDLDSIEHFGKY